MFGHPWYVNVSSNPPTMGFRMVGWAGWVTYDEAALSFPLGGEGKLALGFTGRYRSRLEAAEVTSQLLKMEHAGGTHWQTGDLGQPHQSWPVADHASTHLTLRIAGPGIPNDTGGTARGGAREFA